MPVSASCSCDTVCVVGVFGVCSSGVCGVSPSGSSGTVGSSGLVGLSGVDGLAWLPQSLPNAGFSAEITLTVLPHAFTGMSTGIWMLLPEPTPGDPFAAPSALAPPSAVAACSWSFLCEDLCADLPESACESPLTQWLPNVGFSTPTMSTLLPHRFTGT